MNSISALFTDHSNFFEFNSHKTTFYNYERPSFSKQLGLQFYDCRELLLDFEFDQCMLKLSNFQRLNLKNTKFTDCNLQEANFTGTDLTGATFDQTNIEKADFRTAYNFSINPATNRIRKARFSLAGVAGLLDVYGIEIE